MRVAGGGLIGIREAVVGLLNAAGSAPSLFAIVALFFWRLENTIAANGLDNDFALGDIPQLATALEASLVQANCTAAVPVFVVAIVTTLGHFDHSVAADRIRSETEGRNESSALIPFFDFAVLASLTVFVVTLLLILDDAVPAHRTRRRLA